jgi:Spy/CpxP family protein refolding chaperone
MGLATARTTGISRAAARLVRLACFLLTAATLSGCGGDGVGSLMVDPARYDGYHCQGLAEQLKTLQAREKQLRDLMDKAKESAGGQVVSALAYSSDYQTVLEQQKVLRRTAERQKCQFTAPRAPYTSDQTIR